MDPLRSPGTPWKKPSDVMKKFNKSKKRPSLTSAEDSDQVNCKTKKSLNFPVKTAVNPFRSRKSLKQEHKEVKESKHDNSPGVFSMFRDIEIERKLADSTSVQLPDTQNVLPTVNYENKPNPVKNIIWSDNLPIDWSLKLKARFISKKQFSWTSNLKTSEEASGITGFVRCLGGLSNSPDQECRLDTSTNAHFHQCCLVWKHPHLPWLKLFPRLGGGSAKTSDKTSIFGGEHDVQGKLYSDWCDSFRSLYQLLRARQCPYFYVCTHNYTILFRAAGISGINDIHALLTPSTRGLREVLRQEGVIFTLPLKNPTKNASGPAVLENTLDCDAENSFQYGESMSKNNVADDDDEDDDSNEDDEPMNWLEEMGLETTAFPELNPNKIKIMEKKANSTDHRPESMLYVEGVEVQGLFNFLLNNRNCIPSTGPLAGVPPTLLAPTAFQGATLSPLQAKQAWINQDKNRYHAIQLSGPILPHTIHNLCELFKLSQDGHYTAMFGTLDQTSPFTIFNSCQPTSLAPAVFAQQNLTDCGFQHNVLSSFCSTPSNASILQHLKVENGKFNWS